MAKSLKKSLLNVFLSACMVGGVVLIQKWIDAKFTAVLAASTFAFIFGFIEGTWREKMRW